MSRIAVLAVVAFGVVMGASFTAPLAAQAPASRLKVYCFTGQNASGFVDQSTQARLDSLKDLKEAIVKKKDWLQLVEAESQADVSVEVVERVLLAAGRTNPTSTSYVNDKGKTITTTTNSRAITNYALRTVMRVGSYENPMEGVVSSEYLGGQWRAAAGQVAGEIEKWAKANQGKLRTTVGPAPQPAGAAPKAAAPRAARTPRQTVIDWYLAPTVAAAEPFLLKTTLAQVQAFRESATPEQAIMVALLDGTIAPGFGAARMGQTVASKGQPPSAIVVGGEYPLELAFQPEAVSGDRAFLPISIKYGANPARNGTFELAKEDSVWRIALVDFGEDQRYPRFDSPKFVSEYAGVVTIALERARANARRASVIAQLRTVIAAEETYAAINGGLYAPLECLERPRACAPAADAREFLLSPLNVEGYAGAFHPGAAATAPDLRKAPGVRRALKGWAYVFTPQATGAEQRAYCADATARVCMLPAGAPAKIAGAACPATCQEVK